MCVCVLLRCCTLLCVLLFICSNLSFSELKKQHQFYLKEVEKLKNSIGELEQKHIEEKDEMKLELVMAENTIESLRNELVLKEGKALV